MTTISSEPDYRHASIISGKRSLRVILNFKMMQIIIHDGRTLREIRSDFNRCFPYLQIDFFEFEQGAEERYSAEFAIKDLDKALGEIRNNHHSEEIIINGETKVSHLEKLFREKLGLFIQVLRKSGKTWMQTNATDHWSLEHQNNVGSEMALEIKEEREDITDQYREQP